MTQLSINLNVPPPPQTQLFDLPTGAWFSWEEGLGVIIDRSSQHVLFISSTGSLQSSKGWVNRVVKPVEKVSFNAVLR